MTSALLVSWAEDGLKEFLGRKRPTGLGPSGPGERSPLILPGLLVKAPSTRWASTVARRAGDTRGPAAFTLSRNQRKGGVRPSLRRSPRLAATSPAHAPAAARRCGSWTRRWGALLPFHTSSGHSRTHARLEGRPTAHPPQRAARRRGPARCASPRCGRSHGALGCGRLGFKRTNTCKNASSARRPAQHSTRCATAAAHPDTARRRWGSLHTGQAGFLTSTGNSG
jgi:hypothetical protein